ncbi:MAG: EamA family transporter [Candidatus Poseidoniales archaeon]
MISILPLQSIYIEPLDFQPTWPMHGWLFLLAVVSQVMGWLMISYSLPRLPAVHTSFAILLQPVLTIVWGILLIIRIALYSASRLE